MLSDTSVHAYLPARHLLLLCGDWPDAYYGGCPSYAYCEYCYTWYTPNMTNQIAYMLYVSKQDRDVKPV